MRKTNTSIVLAFVLGIWSTAVLAEDFTINVPLRLTNLDPEINTVAVVCQLYDAAGKPLAKLPDGDGIGVTPDANGNVQQTAVVKINTINGPPSSATTYKCFLVLYGKRATCRMDQAYAGSCLYPMKPGLMTWASGVIPPQP